MKRMIVFGITLVLLVACDKKGLDNPVSALSLDHNSIQMKIGDSWLYRQTFVNAGLTAESLIPDTLTGYSFFQVKKDTTIDSKSFLIVEGRDYEIEKDSVQISRNKFGIYFSDSIITMYVFRTESSEAGYSTGVMKSAASQPYLTRNNFGTSILKKIAFCKLANALAFDSSPFWDFVTPVCFPLVKDSIYVYRDSGSPTGHMKVRRRFSGIESVQVPAGVFESYKFEWLTNEYFSSTDSVSYYDWVGNNGLLKRYAYFPKSVIADELGTPVDSCPSYQLYELMGKNDINPDTLIPWGKR
jgi:hypothetical protein